MDRKSKSKEVVERIKISDCLEHEELREYSLANSYHLYLVGEHLKELKKKSLAHSLGGSAYYISQWLYGMPFNFFLDHDNLCLQLIGNSETISAMGYDLEKLLNGEMNGIRLDLIRKFSQGMVELDKDDTISL